MANSAFTPTNLGTGSSSSSGSGGTNYLSSHFAADALGTVTLSIGDTLSSSTRSSPTTWGTSAGSAIISQSADSTLRGSTNYLVAFTANAQFIESPLFTLDGSDLSKPLLVQFDVSGVSTSDDVQCYIVRYNSSNVLQERITVAGTASATTPFSARVPTGTTTFRGFFVPNATASDKYAIRWLRNASNTSMRLDSFIVGPQSIAMGPALTEWQTNLTFTYGGLGTPTSTSQSYQRRGNEMAVKISGLAGTVSGSNTSIGLPTGYSIDSTKLNSATSKQAVGIAYRLRNATTAIGNNSDILPVFYDGSDTANVYIGYQSSSYGFLKIAGSSLFGSGEGFSVEFTVPISQWSSSNFQTADRAVEEYASNDGSAGVAANNTYNTGMQYGISGSQFPAVASTTATSTTRYLVRFKQAIQPTDKVFIEVFNSTSGEWADISYWSRTGIKPLVNQNDSFYGMAWEAVGTSAPTDIYVSFGNKGRNPSATAGAGFGANGQAWSDIAGTSAYLWRVRKVSGGATVGYPVSSANVVGRTDGNAPSAGYVGETFEDTSSTLFTTSQVNIITRTLQPGNWKITAMTSANSGAGASMTLSISTTSATHDTTYKGFGGLNTINVGSAAAQRYVKISSATTYYIVGSSGVANITGTQPTMVLWERTS